MPTIESSRRHLSLLAQQNQFITTNTTTTTATINRSNSSSSGNSSRNSSNVKTDFTDVHNYSFLDYEIRNSTNTNTSLTTTTEVALQNISSRLSDEFSGRNNLIRFKQMLSYLNSKLTITTTTAAATTNGSAFINTSNVSQSKSSDTLWAYPTLETSALNATSLTPPSASTWLLTNMSTSTYNTLNTTIRTLTTTITSTTPLGKVQQNHRETYVSPQYTLATSDKFNAAFTANNVSVNSNATILTPPQPYALSLTSSSSSGSSNDNNSYGGGVNVDIALIDSSENLLVDGADADYAASVGFGVDSEMHADSMRRSMVHGLERVHKAVRKNVNMKQIFDGGGTRPIEGGGGVEGGSAIDKTDNGGGSSFMLLFEDFGEYFYNYNNGSSVTGTTIINNSNITLDLFNRTNCTNSLYLSNNCLDSTGDEYHNYWALILLLFPILTLFGNILVILAVCRERSLQSVTNYFIVSLAIADLLVAVVPMPFAVYILVNGTWALPNVVCDFYIAMDVICSTSSIFNLVAISIDRYIAVTQPIKYAKHKNSRRVCLTILLVWAISAAIGSPIVMGLNNTPNRDPDLCVFYNTDFVLYSSLSSFYIPCIIMVFLYWSIFKALNRRARKQRAARKPHLSELTGGSVIENIAQTRRLAETALDSGQGSRVMGDEPATNTASGSNEEEDENAISPDIDDCHVIVNDKSTEFMLATVVEETGNVVAQISSTPQLVVADPNGNHDSGYAPSNVDDVLAGAAESSPPDSPAPSGKVQRSSLTSGRRHTPIESSPKRDPALSVAMKPLAFVRYGVQEAMTLARNDSTLSTTSRTSARKDKKNSQASRFTIYKVHKASKKKREKSSAKKERKATKTLAIVLGVFLFCWLPFFTCNVMDALCAKFNSDCRPGVTAFMLTTWLGYINSFVNPVIYTIFNPEFRKAFKKIMHMG